MGRSIKDFSSKKLKDVLRYADQLQAKYCLVVGDQELESNKAELKEMASRSAKTVALTELTSHF